jgi:hypothetical protein
MQQRPENGLCVTTGLRDVLETRGRAPRDSAAELSHRAADSHRRTQRKRRNAEELDLLLTDLFAGRFAYVFVKHKLWA